MGAPSRSEGTRTDGSTTMRHRIVVLGAGYAGASAAGYLARHLHPDDFEITVVNAEPDFVERLRLHQLAAGQPLRHRPLSKGFTGPGNRRRPHQPAAGQPLRHRPLSKVFAGTGIRLRLARVTAVDAAHRTVTVADGD